MHYLPVDTDERSSVTASTDPVIYAAALHHSTHNACPSGGLASALRPCRGACACWAPAAAALGDCRLQAHTAATQPQGNRYRLASGAPLHAWAVAEWARRLGSWPLCAEQWARGSVDKS